MALDMGKCVFFACNSLHRRLRSTFHSMCMLMIKLNIELNLSWFVFSF